MCIMKFVGIVVLMSAATAAQAEVVLSNLTTGSIPSNDFGSVLHATSTTPSLGVDMAIPFTTGLDGAFAVNSVTILIGRDSFPGYGTGFGVRLVASQGGLPGATLGTLSGNLSPAARDFYTYTPQSIMVLQPFSQYFIVMSVPHALGDPDASFTPIVTPSSLSFSSHGWSVGNGHLYQSYHGGSVHLPWFSGGSYRGIFEIDATAVPAPPASLAVVAGLYLAGRRRRRAIGCSGVGHSGTPVSHSARSGLLCSVVALSAGSAMAQPILTNLGTFSGDTSTVASGVSADGSAVVGYGINATGVRRAFRWTAVSGLQSLGELNPGFGATSTSISGDGARVVGWAAAPGNVSRAFSWTSASGMQDLGALPGAGISFANGVSADGTVVVGNGESSTGYRAIRWDASGPQALPSLPGTGGDTAWGVSADGSVTVGVSNPPGIAHAVRWTSAGIQDLGTLGSTGAWSFAVSSDGSVVTGMSNSPSGWRAFRWTESLGMDSLGVLPGGYFQHGSVPNATGINADGSMITGFCRDAGNQERAWLWTSSLGMVDLNSYLAGLGCDLTGWTLTSGTGMSADGSVISGNGIFNGEARAWVVTVPAPSSLGVIAACAGLGMRRRRPCS